MYLKAKQDRQIHRPTVAVLVVFSVLLVMLLLLPLQHIHHIMEKPCFCANSVSGKQQRIWAKVTNRRTSALLITSGCCMSVCVCVCVLGQVLLNHQGCDRVQCLNLTLSQLKHFAHNKSVHSQRKGGTRKAIKGTAQDLFFSFYIEIVPFSQRAIR